ncbi:MAG TPA: TonB-dependent receptor [Planctomycetota bacterium]|nr:TonB-dependent receptor [Planctomycetota bacterium]
MAGSIVLDSRDLARTGERSLPRAIGKAAGLFVQETNLGGGSPILRGLIGNQVLILIDGVRLNDSTTREGPNQSLNSIDPLSVERVEIVRGPSSVLYGSDALGGVILITTRSRLPGERNADAGERATGLQAALDGNANSSVEGYYAGLELSWAGAEDGLFGVATTHDWNDLHSGGGDVPHTGFEGNGLFGSWMHALDDERTLRLALSRTRDFDVPRTDRMNTGFGQTQPANEEWFYALQDRERAVLTYDDREQGEIADSMQVRASLRRYREERTTLSTGSTTRRLESDVTETASLGADWRRMLGSGQRLTWGLDVDYDDVDSLRNDQDVGSGTLTPGSGAFAPGSRYLSTGVFVQDEVLAWDPFFLTVGVRYSYYAFAFEDTATDETVDGDFDALTGSVQLARDLSEATRVGASLSQGFRAPNLADLAKNASFAGGTELANPDLDPEQSWMAELALDHVVSTWSAGVAVFYNHIDDAIGRRLIDPGGPSLGDETYVRENVGEVRYWGSELTASRKLGGAQSPWSTRFLAEAIWGRQFDDIEDPPGSGQTPFYDVPARRVPPVHGLLALRYDQGFAARRGLWAELGLAWALQQDELNPGDLSDPRIDPDGTDGWTRVDVDVGGRIDERGGSTWRVGLHNILDEQYRIHGSGFDAPGFAVVAGLRLEI